jgi:hypothetical protein
MRSIRRPGNAAGLGLEPRAATGEVAGPGATTRGISPDGIAQGHQADQGQGQDH